MEDKLTTREFKSDLEKMLKKIPQVMDKIPKEFPRLYVEAMNKNLKPSFADMEKVIREIAEIRKEPLEHMMVEFYGGMIAHKIMAQLNLKQEGK